ncbi:hypothetical protein [Legionella hackeliae]|uniref:hypothetical protein n=1 Tax=Legionella hackeliae TaxID=449 RepID=UPI000E20B87E|nr:hypothetical protein [Legionella hackeliae]
MLPNFGGIPGVGAKHFYHFMSAWIVCFSSPSLKPVNSQVIYDGDSDHFPLLVDFINDKH